MNLYFLVEGKTEAKLYPRWLAHLLPDLRRVKSYRQADTKNYYLFNAGGFPRIIYNHLPNAIREINLAGNYDYLVMCFDADESTVEAREEEVLRSLQQKSLFLEEAELVLIVHDCCLETWLLGNRELYRQARNQKALRKYTQFYNIGSRDPERMDKPPGYAKPVQQFHFEYFMRLARKQGIRYRKGSPTNQVIEWAYLRQIENRILETNHLASFRHFWEFCEFVGETLARIP